MKEESQQQNSAVLHAADQLFSVNGYSNVTVKDIAKTANVDESFIHSEYSDKSGLCHAWLISLHQSSETRHREILESSAPPIEKVGHYFEHLAEWMEQSGFAGCPFTRTIHSLGSGESPEIRNEVSGHKQFVCDFFIALSMEIIKLRDKAESLGQQLFLLYSAATTEAKNLESLWPIERARDIALAACSQAQGGNASPVNR